MKLKQIETPALVLDLNRMEENMKAMDCLLAGSGVALRPHYKSHKSTAIAHMQLKAGAKGITCAKLSEAEDLIRGGVEDVLIANQITDPGKIARVAALAGCCRLTLCVDDPANVAALRRAAEVQGTTIYCLVEYDIGMDRCGVRSREEVLALAREIMSGPSLVFEGIQAYAGNLAHERDYERRASGSRAIEAELTALKGWLEEQGCPVKEISGVSTGTVQFHNKGSIYTEVQAGSYLFCDAAYREVGVEFCHSLFLLTQVISRREGALITDGGLKSVSVDQTPPVFRDYRDCPVEMSEEHAAIYGTFPQQVGDKLLLIPSHCCTTVNLHDWIYLVRGDRVVDRIPVTSRGKSR